MVKYNKYMLFLFVNKSKNLIILVVISDIIKNRRISIYSLSCDPKLISLLLIIISSMPFATVFV